MTGITQAVFMNQRSFGPPAIGSAYQGGFFAGQISTAGNGVADFNLVVAPLSTGGSSSVQWKTSDTTTSGTTSVIDGPTNSANMNDASHPAAQFCEGLSIGGYTDWYMPAQNELEVCYYNLKPSTTSNITLTGSNSNSVPKRTSNYTAGTPAQTAATDFQSGGSEAFATSPSSGRTWSSTQVSSSAASAQQFSNGFRSGSTKTSSYPVRAVRRVAV